MDSYTNIDDVFPVCYIISSISCELHYGIRSYQDVKSYVFIQIYSTFVWSMAGS